MFHVRLWDVSVISGHRKAEGLGGVWDVCVSCTLSVEEEALFDSMLLELSEAALQPLLTGQIWFLLREDIGFDPGFNSLQGLWEAGQKMRKKSERSPSTKVSQSFLPAVVWSIWLAHNHRVFRNSCVYSKNV
ncbi:hypothetical protein QJS04_geneDACA001189 [Acorus gramineus]|uniref:Uncharacterized protein n=1 Tax=Acorus gramineus TaxID=55184 RepID=A0AAV9AEM5_ACOGR|nr:hypothetical protein QJS04_geneDACA001189 [Acorus gramineus]